MKVFMINSVCGIRSTGRICTDLADILIAHGHECKIAYGRETVPTKYKDIAVRIGSEWCVRMNGVKARILDNECFNAKNETKKLIQYIERYGPDIVHIHNLHGYYMNMELLFKYLAQKGTAVLFTMHDCWAVTGHCAHFTVADCEKWKEGCHECPQKKDYPISILMDSSKKNWSKKKALFDCLTNTVIVTPSNWLAEVMKNSYLRSKKITVIPNGIDFDVFKPTNSDFREVYNLASKYVVLGVATAWSSRKGLDEFIALQAELGDDYQVVLVGLNQNQLNSLPSNIIGVAKTNSVSELAGLYTMADVFVNAGKEETMGLTTVEAMACGTPVVVSNMTAVPEVVDEDGGVVIEEYSVDCFAKEIRKVVSAKYSNTRKSAFKYEKQKQYEKYIALYEEMI